MDLSKLSTADLQALQVGDITRVSMDGLQLLQGAQRQARFDALKKQNPGEYDPTSAEWQAKYGATSAMGTGERVLAGIGRGMTSVGRAVGLGDAAKRFGLPGTKEEADQVDQALLDTTAGTVGNVVGMAAPAAVAIPFTPATIPAAVAAGGITGAITTEGGVGDRVAGAAGGAVGGALGTALPAVVRSGMGLLRGLAQPFTASGRDIVAGRAIERFATQPNALAALRDAQPSVTGARLTVPELTGDTGLATLQRAISTLDPQAAEALAARQMANNAARLEALRSVAGGAREPASRVRRLDQIARGQPTREAAEAARAAAARQAYREAFEAGVDPAMAEALAPQIESLMARPSVQAGMARARQLAAEEGLDIGNQAGSVQGLHYLKTALDDMGGRLRDQPARQRLVQQTAQDLASVLEEIAPAYQAARREFQNRSVPVTRAAIGERLIDRTTGAIRDFSGNQRLQANAFAKALNDEAELIRQSTGFRGGPQTLEDVLTPTQLGRVNAVRNELERLANLSQAANGPGSQTAKMLASQNLLRQFAGPLGLPESFSESVLSQTLMRPVQFGLQAAEPRIQERIAAGLLDPTEARALIEAAARANAVRPPNALERLARRAGPLALANASAQGAAQ